MTEKLLAHALRPAFDRLWILTISRTHFTVLCQRICASTKSASTRPTTQCKLH